MSYGIVRVQKFQAGSVKGIEIHDRRDKDHSHTNKEIDYERTKDNFDLHQTEGTFRQTVNNRIAQLNLPKAVRKDAVVMAQVLVTSDKAFFDKLTPDQTKEFFKQSYEFLKERYGEKNIVSSTVHMDERTPHMHFNFVPVTEDGRLSAKTILNRTDLIKQHDDFFKQIGRDWGLSRGEKDGYKTHLETAEFKKQTAYKEIENLNVTQKQLQERNNAIQEQLKPRENAISCISDLQRIKGEKTLIGQNIKLTQAEFDKLHDQALNGFKIEIDTRSKLKDAEYNASRYKSQYETLLKKVEPMVQEHSKLKKELAHANGKLQNVADVLRRDPELKDKFMDTQKELHDEKAMEKAMEKAVEKAFSRGMDR